MFHYYYFYIKKKLKLNKKLEKIMKILKSKKRDMFLRKLAQPEQPKSEA